MNRQRGLLVALTLAVVACRSPLVDGPEVTAISDQSRTVFELRGLEGGDLSMLRGEKWSVDRWQKLWRIQDPDTPAPRDASISDVPPLAGSYLVTDRSVVFVATASLKRGAFYNWYFFPSEMPSRPDGSESRLSWRRAEFISASVQVP